MENLSLLILLLGYQMALSFADVSELQRRPLSTALETPRRFSKDLEKPIPVSYEYNYSVRNDEFGDMKMHQETRKGNSVEGMYEVVEPDGFKRIVRYTVDEKQGFHAVVTRERTGITFPMPMNQKMNGGQTSKIENTLPMQRSILPTPIPTYHPILNRSPLPKNEDPIVNFKYFDKMASIKSNYFKNLPPPPLEKFIILRRKQSIIPLNTEVIMKKDIK